MPTGDVFFVSCSFESLEVLSRCFRSCALYARTGLCVTSVTRNAVNVTPARSENPSRLCGWGEVLALMQGVMDL